MRKTGQILNDKIAKKDDLKPHPSNPNWTMPKTFGVWKLPVEAKGKRHRYGNYPVRETELKAEFGAAVLIELYYSRMVAKRHADELNGDAAGAQK